mgnify:CR=1 FL=1
MYEINGYIVWYNTKTHKWTVKKDGIVIKEISGIKEVKKWCNDN